MKKFYVESTGDWGYGYETFKNEFDTKKEAEEYMEIMKKGDPFTTYTLHDTAAELKAQIKKLQGIIKNLEKELNTLEN